MTLIDREHRPLITLNIHQGETSLLGEFKSRATRGWRRRKREGGREGGRKREIRDFLEMIRSRSGIPILTHSTKDPRASLSGQRSLSLSLFFPSWPCHAGLSTDRYSVHVPVQTEIQSDRASNHLPSSH